MQIIATLLASAALAHAAPSPATPTITVQPHTIYQLPAQLQNYTAFENQAFRSDGSVLLTAYTNGTIWQLTPPFCNPTFSQVTDFSFDPDVTATLGIVQTKPNTFHVLTSHFNASFSNFTATPGSNKIYRLSFPGPQIEVAARLEEAKFLDGLAKLNDTYLLAGDLQKGVIWGVDLLTGSSRILVTGETLAPYAALKGPLGGGINGLKLHRNEIYFTNTLRSSLGKVRIDPVTLDVGMVETVANFSRPGRPVEENVQLDDLIVTDRGDAFVSLRSESQVAWVQPGGRVAAIYDFGVSWNATSLSMGHDVGDCRRGRPVKMYGTGVFGKYFEAELPL